jgi:hypothetical protein
MPYHVRTADGELAFPSLADVERAYSLGLVGPEDEVREDGAQAWRKAGSLPVLARSRAAARPAAGRRAAQHLPILVAVALSLLALWLILREDPGMRLLGAGLALVVAGLLMRVTSRAFGRGKRLL